MPGNSNDPLAGNSKYRSVRELGQGAFGKVQLAVNIATREQVAIKFVERGHGITKFVAREVMNHSKLLHPHIVQFKEVLLTPVHLGIVLEYAAGGDMFQHVKRSGGLGEADARWFYQQLMIALDYMHSLGVSNRDVKLENTLLDGSRRPLLKLCDFGYSKADTDSLPKSVVGTPGYTAPEVLSNGRTYDGTKCDVWSSAVMLYVMLFCEYPFERPEDEQHPHKFQKMLERTKRLDYRFPKSMPVSQSCKDFIKSILVLEPSQRPSVQQVQAHPWYRTDLPAGVTSMNEECLKLKGFTAGHQTEEEIRSIIREAMKGPNNSNGLFQDAFDEEIGFR